MAVCIGSGLASLVGGEVALRFLAPRPGFVSNEQDLPGLLITDTTAGYRLAPGFGGVLERADYITEVATDSLGLRIASSRRDSASNLDADGRPRILALGNSFTFGLGVSFEEAWPQQLGRLVRAVVPTARVYNGAVPGYSLQQIRARATGLIDATRPHVMLLGLFVDGWPRLSDPYILVNEALVSASLRDFVRPTDGGYVRSSIARPWLRELDLWLLQHSRLGAHLMHAAHGIAQRLGARGQVPSSGGTTSPSAFDPSGPSDALMAEVGQLDLLARRVGALLVVVLVNGQERDGSFSTRQSVLNGAVAERCGAIGIPVVDPLPTLVGAANGRPVHRFPSDGHWSSQAHQLVASVIADSLSSWGMMR